MKNLFTISNKIIFTGLLGASLTFVQAMEPKVSKNRRHPGITLLNPDPKSLSVTNDERKIILELHSAGISKSDIATQSGRPERLIKQIILHAQASTKEHGQNEIFAAEGLLALLNQKQTPSQNV